MAATPTAVAGTATVIGNKRMRVFNVVYSGNYATGGDTITAAAFGLRKLDQVIAHSSVATSTDLATANPVAFRIAAAGTSVVALQYEGSAAGTALSEKTGAEAYATGSNVTVTVIGY